MADEVKPRDVVWLVLYWRSLEERDHPPRIASAHATAAESERAAVKFYQEHKYDVWTRAFPLGEGEA